MRKIARFCFASWLCAVVMQPSVLMARETYVSLVQRLVAEANVQKIERPDLERQLFELANAYRHSKGLRPLALDTTAHEAGVAHALDMMHRNYMGHIASTGQDFDGRMRALRDGALVLPSMGENAAMVKLANPNDPHPAQKLFQTWVKSPPHRHTLLSQDFLKLATGVVARGGTIYADQIFTGPDVSTNLQRTAPEGGTTLY